MNLKLLSVAKGETPADLVIRNGKIVNVYSGEICEGGVAVCGDTIAAVGELITALARTPALWMRKEST